MHYVIAYDAQGQICDITSVETRRVWAWVRRFKRWPETATVIVAREGEYSGRQVFPAYAGKPLSAFTDNAHEALNGDKLFALLKGVPGAHNAIGRLERARDYRKWILKGVQP